MKKERNRGVYCDSLIRKMSTIIFLIFSFFEKKEGEVSILAASLLPDTFMEFVW